MHSFFTAESRGKGKKKNINNIFCGNCLTLVTLQNTNLNQQMAEEKATKAVEESTEAIQEATTVEETTEATQETKVETPVQDPKEFLENFNWEKYEQGIEHVDDSKLRRV